MSSLILLPSTSDAFSTYQPSSNAHVDVLPSISIGQGKKRVGSTSSSSESGVRRIKLSIKAGPSEPVKDRLDTLLSSIAPILSGSPTSTTYHQLSTTCHKVILQPHTLGPTIYGRVKEELEKSTAALAREWRASILSRESGWLGRLVQGWRTWESRVELLSAIFVYLDRVYSNSANGIASIRDLAIATFRKTIWENELLVQKTRDDVLSWVTAERESETISSDLRPTISALSTLSKLLSKFETLSKPYIDLTVSHYQSASNENLVSVEAKIMPALKYVDWALDKMSEEYSRATETMSIDVAEAAVETVQTECGKRQGDRVIRRALDEVMDNANAPGLIRLYHFSTAVDVFDTLARSLQDHLEARLKALISDPANDAKMIDETLKLKRFADQAVASLFATPPTTPVETVQEEEDIKPESSQMNKDIAVEERTPDLNEQLREAVRGVVKQPKVEKLAIGQSSKGAYPRSNPFTRPILRFPKEALAAQKESRSRQFELEEAVRTGFKLGMGSRQNAPAEWIAKHLDVAMRRGQGAGTEAEFNKHLDEIIALIGFTKDKDVFKAFYSGQLAKRLLLSKSASDDMERNMIVKLQQEMGEEFTSGDVMMKDLQLSETLVKSYQSAQAKNPEDFKGAGDFTANVLTESAWPAYPLLKDGWNFKLTPDLQSSVDAFTSWYSTQHKNRQLSWRFQLATVTLTARFGSSRYEVGVSLFQAVVLLQFNEEDSLTFKEVHERTGIETQELVRTLQSLALGRKGTRVLLKKPAGKEVNPTDVFAWNKGFSSDRIKFKINQIQQDMTAEEAKATNEQVQIDRVSVLEATLVRIMKARKKMTLQLLIDAVVSDVSKRFPPDVKEIKKRVESLIEREFLMRDEEERGVLHYLA